MTPKSRLALQIFGAVLLAAFLGLIARSRVSELADNSGRVATSAERGEEVYASHDCTDCHLAPHVLKARRAKGLQGLIRVRKDMAELTLFLQSDQRHETFLLISEADRLDLIAYLKTLQ
jgi:cytochrome c2